MKMLTKLSVLTLFIASHSVGAEVDEGSFFEPSSSAIYAKSIISDTVDSEDLKVVSYHIARFNSAIPLYSPIAMEGSGKTNPLALFTYQCARLEIDTCIDYFANELAAQYGQNIRSESSLHNGINKALMSPLQYRDTYSLLNTPATLDGDNELCDVPTVSQCTSPLMDLPAMSKLPEVIVEGRSELNADYLFLRPQFQF